MRPVEALVFLALVSSCVRSQKSTPRDRIPDGATPAGTHGDSAPSSASDTKVITFVNISAFDCAKVEQFPGVPAIKGLVPPGAGIRGWDGGGPHGANWNATDLRCTIRATSPCTKGQVGIALRVGRAVIAERQAAFAAAGNIDAEIVVPFESWKRHLDEKPRSVATSLPVRTAVFRALVVVDCAAPTKASLAEWRYTSVAAEDSFVAGFAWGE